MLHTALVIALLSGLISATPTPKHHLLLSRQDPGSNVSSTATGTLIPEGDEANLGAAKALVSNLEVWQSDDGFLGVIGEIQDLALDSGLDSTAVNQLKTTLGQVATDPHMLSESMDQMTAALSTVASARRDLTTRQKAQHIDRSRQSENPHGALIRRARIPNQIRCFGRIYIASFISETLKAACNHLSVGSSVGVNSYPHKYSNFDNIFAAGDYQEYPLKTSRPGGVWEQAPKQGGPGLDRLIFTQDDNGVCDFIGVVTHKTFVAGAIVSDKFFPC